MLIISCPPGNGPISLNVQKFNLAMKLDAILRKLCEKPLNPLNFILNQVVSTDKYFTYKLTALPILYSV